MHQSKFTRIMIQCPRALGEASSNPDASNWSPTDFFIEMKLVECTWEQGYPDARRSSERRPRKESPSESRCQREQDVIEIVDASSNAGHLQTNNGDEYKSFEDSAAEDKKITKEKF